MLLTRPHPQSHITPLPTGEGQGGGALRGAGGDAFRLIIINIMIKTENLTKIFRTEEVETVALNGVSINVEDGEFVAIMGPSG